jgi:glycerol-3-phosphate dehydrogenase
MAHHTLRSIRSRLPEESRLPRTDQIFDPTPAERCMPTDLDGATCQRLLGRYGRETPAVLSHATKQDFERIGESPNTWLELRHAAREEGVVHLDDLLLRRLRLGVTLPNGAVDFLDHIQPIARQELNWGADRWEAERLRYLRLWERAYSVR